mgnify:CR=1 FL=1
MDCPLCALPPEHVVWEDGRCRVIRVDDPVHPGFCRVVWGEHVAEMTDLSRAEDAARVAGCSYWRVFYRITLPIVKPGLATCALFVFILNWSDYLIALLLTTRDWVWQRAGECPSCFQQFPLFRGVRCFCQEHKPLRARNICGERRHHENYFGNGNPAAF